MTFCIACQRPLDDALAAKGDCLHPACEPLDVDPNVVVSELLSIIADHINFQPRSLQKRIGPSELGVPCDRRIGYKLAGTPEANVRNDVPWLPFIGTAIHEQFADLLSHHEVHNNMAKGAPQRLWVEERLTVGEIHGTPITGSCDLFDAHTGLVLDWKTTSSNQLRENYRPHGPGEQYRIQAHLYGRGWQLRGFAVRNVMLVWFSRDRGFNERHVWFEPYDESVALAALERASQIQNALTWLGSEFTLPTLPTADAHCLWCPYFSRNATQISVACPGHPTDKADTAYPFDDLIPTTQKAA